MVHPGPWNPQAVADGLRPDIELPGALRWLRRRLRPVYAALHLIKGLMADRFCACEPTLGGFRPCLDAWVVLLALREVAAVHLAVLPPPLGFSFSRSRMVTPPVNQWMVAG